MKTFFNSLLNLTRAVQLCVDIAAHVISGHEIEPPGTMGQSFDLLVRLHIVDVALGVRLKKAVGFRNIAVHNYEVIDWAIVYAICTRHLNDFVDFARAVVAALDQSGKRT